MQEQEEQEESRFNKQDADVELSFYIRPRVLVEDHLHHQVHVDLFPINELSAVQVLARDLYVGVYDKEPPATT